MEFKKGKLLIGSKEYWKKISHPTVKQTVSLDNPAQVNSMLLTQSETVCNGQCIFAAYSLEVRTVDDVHNGYIKVTQLNPAALHVMCAFRIPGNDPALQDFEDNNQAGGGRVLLS